MSDVHPDSGGLAIGASVGNYRIEAKIGEGGMGAVYLATHPLLGRKAAVKVLLPEHSKRGDVVNRFFNEAKTAASLRHPALVEVFDFGFLADGAGYLIMDFIEGERLTERLGRVAPLAFELAADLGRQIAQGVAAAHGQGIVHRDLKPDNIMLAPDPEHPQRERVKILDFGIAKLLLPQEPGSKGVTTTGMVLGTPLYMAPEQCRGAGQVDHRADIYSVGCIVYQMLTGRPPFDLEGVGEILAAHLHQPVPSLRALDPSMPEAVAAVVMRALEKDPAARQQTMSDLAAELESLIPPGSVAAAAGRVSGTGLAPPSRGLATGPTAWSVPAMSAATLPHGPPPRGRRGGAWLVAGGLVLAVGAAAVLWQRPAFLAGVFSSQPRPNDPGPRKAPAVAPEPPTADEPPTPVSPAASAGQANPPDPGEAAASAGQGDPADPGEAAAPASDENSVSAEQPRPQRDPGRPARRPPSVREDRPNPASLAYERALRHRAAGREAEAVLAFRVALAHGGLPSEDRADADRQLVSLGRKFGEIDIRCDVPGVLVTVDGKARGRTPLPNPVLLLPGQHEVRLSRPGYETVARTVTLAAGQRVPMSFTLPR